MEAPIVELSVPVLKLIQPLEDIHKNVKNHSLLTMVVARWACPSPKEGDGLQAYIKHSFCCIKSCSTCGYRHNDIHSYYQECITKSMQLPLEMRLGIGHLLRHSNVYLCKL